MIVKPYISFLITDSDGQLLTRTGGILTSLDGNPNYTTPAPTLPVVRNAMEDFSEAVSNAEGGGVALTAVKKAKRAVLVALLRQLASYVQVTANGNMAVLMSSGFPVQKPQRQPIGVLPPPANVTLTFGARTGELRGVASPVAGAAIYNWHLSTAAAPTVVIQTMQTTASTVVFPGLTPGVTYNAVVNVVGSAGPSSWVGPASQIAV